MRPTPNDRVERGRIKDGPMPSTATNGNNGWFRFSYPGAHGGLNVIVSDGLGWEHVSISVKGRCPTWDEMCFVKDLFWDKEECVIQYHPRESVYVRTHPYVLHLWKPVGIVLPEPDPLMVGLLP